MKNIIIFGNGEFAKLMKYYIDNDTDYKILAITVDRSFINSDNDEIDGIKVLPFDEIVNRFSPNECSILIAIGYSKMNTIRENIFKKCKKLGFSIASYISSTAIIAGNSVLGEGNIILEDVLIQPFVQIGDCNIIWYKSAIAHNCNIGDFNTFAGMSSVSGDVVIENNCFIGNNSTIKDKLTIANYTLVGAGSYINYNTSEYDVFVPCKSKLLEKKSTSTDI